MTGGLNGGEATTKGGNIILRRVSVPNDVQPGEAFDVDVEVSNGAAYINPWDPDKCGLAPPGYKIRVVLIGTGGERLTKGPMCHTTTEVGTRDVTYTFTVQAPDSGRAEVEAHVEMVGSGKQTDSVDASAQVTTTEPERPDSGGDSSDSGSNPFAGRDDGGNGGGGSSPFAALTGGGTEQIAGIILLGILAWLAASASDTVEAVA